MGWLKTFLAVSGVALLCGGVDTDEDEVARLDDQEYELVDADTPKDFIKLHTKKKKDGTTVTGYGLKSEYNNLNINTVPIPANFAGLEAQMIPSRLQDQLFRITEVIEDEDYVEVTARHVWYDNLKNYTLWEATADTNYTGAAVCRNILTNALSPAVSHVASDCTDAKPGSEFDYKQKNIVEAFLDPENGVCAKFGLSLIRNNWDFYCLKDVGYNRGMVIENGKNLLGVERTESIENLVTRVAPIAKKSNGDIVWLNYNGKKYVDSSHINEYSCPHVELYDTGIQIGKNDVTEQNVQQKLLEAAQARFTDDHVDLPEVEMTIEFLSLGDTEEYAQYRGLDKVYLYDILTIHDTIRGYNYSAQVVGVEHDILTGMLTSVTIGKLTEWDGTRKIATWQVPEVNGENIRLKSIMAGAYAPGSINETDLANGIITADKINVNQITAINAILGTAQIADAEIASANIMFAQIKDADVTNLIAHDAITDKYYIRKLAVDNAQFVHATVGELIVKAADNHYYKLDVNAQGGITTTDVTSTLSNGEIAAGVTSDGHSSIIETDLTVSDLAASNMKGINALIDKITASTINVTELFARQATITQLNTADISNNQSMQLYVGNNAYTKKSGIEITANGVEISGGKYIKLKAGTGGGSGGTFTVDGGNFSIDGSGNVTMTGTVTATAGSIGGWTLGSSYIGNNSSQNTSTVGMVNASGSSDIVFWAGGAYNGTGANAPKFIVQKDGTVTLTALNVLNEQGTITPVNLANYPLWKTYYGSVKNFTSAESGGTVTLTLTTTDSTYTVNFSSATPLTVTGSWSGGTYTVVDQDGNTLATTSVYLNVNGTGSTSLGITVTESSPGGGTLRSASGELTENVQNKTVKLTVNGIEKSSISTKATFDAGATGAGVSASWSGAQLTVSRALSSSSKSYTTTIGGSWSGSTYNVSNSNGVMWGVTVTATPGTWSNGSMTISATSGGTARSTATVTMPNVTVAAGTWTNGATTVTAKHGTHQAGSLSVTMPNVTVAAGTWANGVTTVTAKHGTYQAGSANVTMPNVTLSSGGWSNGSNTITAKHGTLSVGSTSVAIPNGSNWSAQYVNSTTTAVTVHVGGKAINGTVNTSDAYNAGVKKGNNDAYSNQYVIGTCYTITAHSGEWVKVSAIGTGYSRVPYMS